MLDADTAGVRSWTIENSERRRVAPLAFWIRTRYVPLDPAVVVMRSVGCSVPPWVAVELATSVPVGPKR